MRCSKINLAVVLVDKCQAVAVTDVASANINLGRWDYCTPILIFSANVHEEGGRV